MIRDKTIREIASQYKQFGQEIELFDFARAIYEQGRADQRESDARLCESICFDRPTIGDAIRANAGDIAP